MAKAPRVEAPNAEAPAYEVINDLPIPERIRGSRETKYPFATMNVNAGFKFSADELKRVNAAVNSYKRNHEGQNFTVRRIDENTYGCWRIE
ncbi:hypothetical protein [Phyllobacterium sophorae]|uniref:Uncharacterized protein n=1 Tax=Phyllobacterium sophorae TaxID=1520277 RepID=A0A2P7BE34_9HYPH|nr:hypothetical protein [Phyllobacterium sophorae]PSH64685.1 hypothetical protein CU103_12445 [Phyllobacterium sophorae]